MPIDKNTNTTMFVVLTTRFKARVTIEPIAANKLITNISKDMYTNGLVKIFMKIIQLDTDIPPKNKLNKKTLSNLKIR